MQSIIMFLLVGVVSWACATEAGIWISPTGSDTTGDGSEGNPYATFAKAVDASSSSSSVTTTVWVAEGTYVFAEYKYVNKKIEVRSLSDAEHTVFAGSSDSAKPGILYCNNTSISISGITFSNSWRSVVNSSGAVFGSLSTVEDCIFTENYTSNTPASALYCQADNFVIRRCVFRNNMRTNSTSESIATLKLNGTGSLIEDCIFENNMASKGGACYLGNSSTDTITVRGCTFIGNSALNNYGGGIYGSGKIFVSDCTFSNNVSAYGGGAINTFNGSVIEDCTFVGNRSRYGAALYVGDVGVTNCVFEGNVAGNESGGINFQSGVNYLSHSIFRNNTALTNGYGAVKNAKYVDNCLFVGNVSAVQPAGLHLMTGGEIYNCTIVDNVVTNNSGVVGLLSYGRTYNTILWNNHFSKGTDNDYYGASGYGYITNSCVGVGAVDSDAGNISSDPRFVDSENGDFQLLRHSPCVDAGMTFAWMSGDTDLAGAGRVNESIVDMGAYEYYPSGTATLITIH